MKLSKSLKKFLISGTVLLMFASVGASVNNITVNARHVHTHRVYRHRSSKRNHRIRRAKRTKRTMHRHSRKNVRSWKHKRNIHRYNEHKLVHRHNVRNWRHYRKYHHAHKVAKRAPRHNLTAIASPATHHYVDDGFNPFTASAKQYSDIFGGDSKYNYMNDKMLSKYFSPEFMRDKNQAIHDYEIEDTNYNGPDIPSAQISQGDSFKSLNYKLRNHPGYAGMYITAYTNNNGHYYTTNELNQGKKLYKYMYSHPYWSLTNYQTIVTNK